MNEPRPRRRKSVDLSRGGSRSRRRPASRWGRAALAVVGAIFFVTSLRAGYRGFASDLRLAFGSAPMHAIAPELMDQARMLRRRIPRGDSILYLGNQNPPDNWYSRLWQRALYPRRLLILERAPSAVKLDTAARPRLPGLDELRAAYPIRYAISAGNPPADPGFIAHEELPPVPGFPYAVWFGELAP